MTDVTKNLCLAGPEPSITIMFDLIYCTQITAVKKLIILNCYRNNILIFMNFRGGIT